MANLFSFGLAHCPWLAIVLGEEGKWEMPFICVDFASSSRQESFAMFHYLLVCLVLQVCRNEHLADVIDLIFRCMTMLLGHASRMAERGAVNILLLERQQ